MDLLPGTLDLLVLRILDDGPLHGYAIARRIESLSEDVLNVEQGSLYPALYRLERAGWIKARRGKSDTGRSVKLYALTPAGRRRLGEEVRGGIASWRRSAGWSAGTRDEHAASHLLVGTRPRLPGAHPPARSTRTSGPISSSTPSACAGRASRRTKRCAARRHASATATGSGTAHARRGRSCARCRRTPPRSSRPSSSTCARRATSLRANRGTRVPRGGHLCRRRSR